MFDGSVLYCCSRVSSAVVVFTFCFLRLRHVSSISSVFTFLFVQSDIFAQWFHLVFSGFDTFEASFSLCCVHFFHKKRVPSAFYGQGGFVLFDRFSFFFFFDFMMVGRYLHREMGRSQLSASGIDLLRYISYIYMMLFICQVLVLLLVDNLLET